MKGTPVIFDDQVIASLTDVAKVRKLYKLNGGGEDGSKSKRRRKDGTEEGSRMGDDVVEMNGTGDVGKERKELEVAVLGLMALRGAV